MNRETQERNEEQQATRQTDERELTTGQTDEEKLTAGQISEEKQATRQMDERERTIGQSSEEKLTTGQLSEAELARQVRHQMRVITQGAAEVVGEEELERKVERSLRENKPLVIKFGMDPSAPDLHLGHAVPLRRLKQMQDMGHTIKIIIGDFTGRIGDPTGKAKGRKALSNKQVADNAETYKQQVFKILDREKTEIYYNGEWLELLGIEDVLKMASTMTVARMLERDDFQSRFASNTPIGLHEFFYPLLQAYDSVELQADLELGGTDQTFNVLMGRTLQKSMGQEPQAAVFMPILEGLDGKEKMSKSLGNYIGIAEEPQVMFKKVMEVPDHLILRYFELATDETPERLDHIREAMADGKNPRDIKLMLAETITRLYHGEAGAEKGKKFFEEAFQKKEAPEDIPELDIPMDCDTLSSILGILAAAGFAESKAACRRLIAQGGMRKNGEKVDNPDIPIANGDVLRLGKKEFLRLHKTV